jgi:hypothetical protein
MTSKAKPAATVKPEDDKGFTGIEVDKTPNEHYTVAGVVAGKPTPETDHKAHLEAHADVTAARFPEKK